VVAAALTCILILDACLASAIVCVVAIVVGSVGGRGFAAAAAACPAMQAEFVPAAGFRVSLPVVTNVAASKSVPSSSSPPH